MYSVYQHWDPLKVCIVGQSYRPQFYDFIKNKKVRNVFYKIAEETEEDYQKLISVLTNFDVEILRPEVSNSYIDHLDLAGNICSPPMCPRDFSAMIGNTFYFEDESLGLQSRYQVLRGKDWPDLPDQLQLLPQEVINELQDYNFHTKNILRNNFPYEKIIELIKQKATVVKNKNINSAMCTRIGKDLYFGKFDINANSEQQKKLMQELFPSYRCHILEIEGHTDACFCPVVPGLILSIPDITSYKETFPDWEVLYIEGWKKFKSFNLLKRKNKGRWWVPGQEHNNDFTNFVEQYMNHWTGYVEETVFDVNLLVLDRNNVICHKYNKKAFDVFSKYNITPHIVGFRHSYFWDGGLHCITSDVHREGVIEDYFPNRNAT